MNTKKFHSYVTPYLLKINDQKYHLNENKLLSFLEDDRLYKVYRAYLKSEEVKHSDKELNKFLNYYCQVVKAKNIKKAFKNLKIKKQAVAPLVAVPLAAKIFAYVGVAWSASSVLRGISEQFKKASNLIDAAQDILKYVQEYNSDYGFGKIQNEVNDLIKNLNLLIQLFPTVTSNIESEKDQNKIEQFTTDAQKFITALTEAEKQLVVMNSYLIEEKGIGTKISEGIRDIGFDFGIFETDTMSLFRAISDFLPHTSAYRIKLEQALANIATKLETEAKSQSPSENKEESLETPNSLVVTEDPAKTKQFPKQRAVMTSQPKKPAPISINQDFDDSDLEELADITID